MIGVPDKFNMVDMGGIDVVESQGIAVEGLFNRLINAIQNCRHQVLYNWKFAEIPIVPSNVELVFDGEKVTINNCISVTSDDIVHIYSIEHGAVLEDLSVTDNGIYLPNLGVDGFSRVEVNVNTGLPVVACELFRHIMFSNSASDRVRRSDRWFQRNTNEPVLFLGSAFQRDGTLLYTGYAAISFSVNGITGTNSDYGDLTGTVQKETSNGTLYYVQRMNGFYPPAVDSGRIAFMYAISNYEFIAVPDTLSILMDAESYDFVGNQSLISFMYTLIDLMYREYYS